MDMENENYLADWLAGKISDAQLQQLVGATDFAAFVKIRLTLDNSVLQPSANQDHFAQIKQKMAARPLQEKTRRVVPLWVYAAAACLLLSVGWYQLFFMSNEIRSGFGSNKTIALDDGSKVTLNAKSELCHANLFRYNRNLELEGEAFFEVTHGRSFTVKTKLGEVRVLGTKFTVTAFGDYFEVVCFQGKVAVHARQKNTILTAGETLRLYDNTAENWADALPSKPLWMQGETTLKKVPVQYVFAAFERQFNLKVNYPESVAGIKFSGSFSHQNAETALQSICIPLQLKFSKTASGTIEISE